MACTAPQSTAEYAAGIRINPQHSHDTDPDEDETNITNTSGTDSNPDQKVVPAHLVAQLGAGVEAGVVHTVTRLHTPVHVAHEQRHRLVNTLLLTAAL